MKISEKMAAVGFTVKKVGDVWECYLDTHNGGDGFEMFVFIPATGVWTHASRHDWADDGSSCECDDEWVHEHLAHLMGEVVAKRLNPKFDRRRDDWEEWVPSTSLPEWAQVDKHALSVEQQLSLDRAFERANRTQ